MKPEFLIALSERLRRHARRKQLQGTALAVDMRAAAMVCDRHAALKIADEAAATTTDGELRRRLEREALELWQRGVRP